MSQQLDVRQFYTRPQVGTLVFKDSTGTPVNLTSYTAELKVVSLDDTDTYATTLTTANGGLSLGTTNGLVTINWHTFIASLPEVGRWILHVITPSGGNVFVTSGTIVVEDKP